MGHSALQKKKRQKKKNKKTKLQKRPSDSWTLLGGDFYDPDSCVFSNARETLALLTVTATWLLRKKFTGKVKIQ